MSLSNLEILKRLGQGMPLAAICAEQGWSHDTFQAWWTQECRKRVPASHGQVRMSGVQGSIRIERDGAGVPSISAESDADLFFGFGYATAQDRLFQLDFLRRGARGRLAEILGPEAVESDRLYRTLGLSQIAEAEWQSLPRESADLLTAYTAGINACMEQCRGLMPIEFDLLDYRPEPWSPVDSLALAGEFRWYLTGRFPVIVIPELVKRVLGEGQLYRAFLEGEVDSESIMPPGSYLPASAAPGRVGTTISSADEGAGSNNWVLHGKKTASGQPIVASDPHVPFAAVCMWHEVCLKGRSFHVAGVSYAGLPGIMIGRSEHLAWGITNNICSIRDLYQEKTDPAHPGCFLYDGRWEPAHERSELIQVRGASPVVQVLRSSRNGPIVDEVLPPLARGTGPVSLRWLGSEVCHWLPAMLAMNRARNVEGFREATRDWKVPTFNLVFADSQGRIGHQCVGRIPVRAVAERGYRPGWDSQHQWSGVIPFEGMPNQLDPKRKFCVTANNRLAPDDYPYPLSGTWATGLRARRIREELETKQSWSMQDCQRLQMDVASGRATECVPHLLAMLRDDSDAQVRHVVSLLRDWDGSMLADSVSATIFHVFFVHWCKRVAAERLPADVAEFASANAAGLATALLHHDELGWFIHGNRREIVRQALLAALNELSNRLGPVMESWQWGRLHTLQQKHFLSGRGDLGQLLDRSGLPVPGDSTTVCNTTPDAAHRAWLGATYRMVVDFANAKHGLWSVILPGQSGHPGSPHYDDRTTNWTNGELHFLDLDSSGLRPSESVLQIVPAN